MNKVRITKFPNVHLKKLTKIKFHQLTALIVLTLAVSSASARSLSSYYHTAGGQQQPRYLQPDELLDDEQVELIPIQSEQPDQEMELVELVPLRRVPRGVRPMQQQGPPQQRRFTPRYQQRQQQQQQPQLVQMVPMQERYDEPLEASASKRDPLVAAETGHGHGGHGHDYVDYGAYTGGYGAFGWYSDHPVHTHGY
jgi:hypothetical protein